MPHPSAAFDGKFFVQGKIRDQDFHIYQASKPRPCRSFLLSHLQARVNCLPLTPMSDQDRISPYNINTISSRQVMRIKKKYQ